MLTNNTLGGGSVPNTSAASGRNPHTPNIKVPGLVSGGHLAPNGTVLGDVLHSAYNGLTHAAHNVGGAVSGAGRAISGFFNDNPAGTVQQIQNKLNPITKKASWDTEYIPKAAEQVGGVSANPAGHEHNEIKYFDAEDLNGEDFNVVRRGIPEERKGRSGGSTPYQLGTTGQSGSSQGGSTGSTYGGGTAINPGITGRANGSLTFGDWTGGAASGSWGSGVTGTGGTSSLFGNGPRK